MTMAESTCRLDLIHYTKPKYRMNLHFNDDPTTLCNLFQLHTIYFGPVKINHRKRTLRVKMVDIAFTRPYRFNFECCRFFLFAY